MPEYASLFTTYNKMKATRESGTSSKAESTEFTGPKDGSQATSTTQGDKEKAEQENGVRHNTAWAATTNASSTLPNISC